MIKGLFYSEVRQRSRACDPQAPEKQRSVRQCRSYIIIIDKALCGKIITGGQFRAQQMKIVGYPVCIEDDKYHRNARCPTSRRHHTDQFFGRALSGGNGEGGGFLYNADQKKELLGTILHLNFKRLNTPRQCTIPVDTANVVSKTLPHFTRPSLTEWDLALQQIVPFIDGVRYVKRISLEADVEIAIVKVCPSASVLRLCHLDRYLPCDVPTST
ncbi:putative nitrogen permease regulator 2 [Phytophthora infestans]|uniref:Putative nitrogen permease regulator 2 n=1 Tax=Phytophthora infestans TaxID=4787 RepID=A0A8S9UY09_PHYIN|nr:putative nitrogen permease regulator 2 [Phytophthora infestans]